MTITLYDLQILALDCQATGAGPGKGHLLEIGWVKTCAASTVDPLALPVQSYLVRLPQDVEIPQAVQRVTGISKEALENALSSASVRQKVVKTANETATADQMDGCPTIIHYARFEEPFLRGFQVESNRPKTFPFFIICTHEIAKRLLPGLPRRGLRAVAGYFGHSVPRYRRSADHAVATAFIWKQMVKILHEDCDIQYLDQLTDWLNRTIPESRTGRVYPMNRKIRLDLPEKPGIYRMLRSNGDLLYIGKAKSLKHRVNSYFRQKGPQAEHTLEMLSQAANLDVTQTGSALEAAILESDEIKHRSPPYNVALRQGRRKLVFCSKDLLHQAFEADEIHRIGPLPDGKLTEAVSAFGVWHAEGMIDLDDEHNRIGYAILGMPEKYAPEMMCLQEGFEIFRRQHQNQLNRQPPLRILTGLGRRLWRKRLDELEDVQPADEKETVEDETVGQESEPAEKPTWTPETVAQAIEKFTMRSALLIRRSRWLCLLCESTLAWEARDSEARRKIVLLFENGAVGHREEVPIEKETPVSPGYAKRIGNRQKIFDLATYERLRVVTTELRRIVTEGRKIEIRLSPKAILRRKELARVLPWV